MHEIAAALFRRSRHQLLRLDQVRAGGRPTTDPPGTRTMTEATYNATTGHGHRLHAPIDGRAGTSMVVHLSTTAAPRFWNTTSVPFQIVFRLTF